MTRGTRRHVTRGAVTPIGRSQPTSEPPLREASQPALSHRDVEQVMARRKRVIEPRLNNFIKTIRLLQEAGNHELYRFTAPEKANLLGIVGREVDELRKALEHGTRGARYVSIEELGGEQY